MTESDTTTSLSVQALSRLLVMFIVAWPIMLAWNAIALDIFNLPEITYWQAFLLRFIFKALMS